MTEPAPTANAALTTGWIRFPSLPTLQKHWGFGGLKFTADSVLWGPWFVAECLARREILGGRKGPCGVIYAFGSWACRRLASCFITAWWSLVSNLSPAPNACKQLDGTKFSLAFEKPVGPVASKNIYRKNSNRSVSLSSGWGTQL